MEDAASKPVENEGHKIQSDPTLASSETKESTNVTEIHADCDEKNVEGGDSVVPALQDKIKELQLTDMDTTTPKKTAKNKKEDVTNDDEARAASEEIHDSKAQDRKKEVKKKPTVNLFSKLVFRNLPPTLQADEFLEILQPDPEHFNYFLFTCVNEHYGPGILGAAYMNFVKPDLAAFYIGRFNGFVIVDQRGVEYPMEVEFAICQTVPKPITKVDPLMGKVRQTETFKKFLAMFNDSADGVIGVRPDFTDAKAMSEHVLKEIEDKEANKGKIQSTPLLDSLREKLQAERDKREKERERQIERRKERDRQRAIRREARREKREQQRREKREKERREREKRERERRESKLKKANAEKLDKQSEKANPSETPSESKEKKEVQVEKVDSTKEKENKSSTARTERDAQAAQGPSSSRAYQQPRVSKEVEHKRDDYNYKDKVPRRPRNDRRYRNDRHQGAENEKDRAPKKVDDKSNSGSTAPAKPETSKAKSVDPVGSSKVDSKQEPNTSTSTSAAASSDIKKSDSKESAGSGEKPRTKIVKKVVKIVRVRSNDGVPTEGRVVERKVVRNADEKTKSNPENRSETFSASKTKPSEGSTSKEEVPGSSAADRSKKGRPDIQIYRPGSWRQGGSRANNKSGGNSTNKGNASTSVSNAQSDKTKSTDTTSKAKETPEG